MLLLRTGVGGDHDEEDNDLGAGYEEQQRMRIIRSGGGAAEQDKYSFLARMSMVNGDA